MKIFMLKSLLVAALMFISVLAGIQWAKDGIDKTRGFDVNRISSTDTAKTDDKKSFENDMSHDLTEKQQKLEKMNAFNLFSSIGKNMSEGISKTSEKLLNSITK